MGSEVFIASPNLHIRVKVYERHVGVFEFVKPVPAGSLGTLYGQELPKLLHQDRGNNFTTEMDCWYDENGKFVSVPRMYRLAPEIDRKIIDFFVYEVFHKMRVDSILSIEFCEIETIVRNDVPR